jgi:hypothetical protein
MSATASRTLACPRTIETSTLANTSQITSNLIDRAMEPPVLIKHRGPAKVIIYDDDQFGNGLENMSNARKIPIA